MGCHFIPNKEHGLVTISGSSAVRLWDIETQKCVQCIGHEMSVRALSILPDNPCIFLTFMICKFFIFLLTNLVCIITGGRDGIILAWDTRESSKCLQNANEAVNNMVPIVCNPFRKYAKAHLDNIRILFFK